MYYCENCKREVLVRDLPKPIRACNCIRIEKRAPKKFWELVMGLFFGMEFYEKKPSKIITDMSGTAKGIGDGRV